MPVAQRQATLVSGSENRATPVRGTDNGYFIAQAWNLDTGRTFLEGELRSGRAACIIGTTVRDRLFGNDEAIGRAIRVNKISCEVIGVLGPHVEFPEWAELWTPLVLDPSAARGDRRFDV